MAVAWRRLRAVRARAATQILRSRRRSKPMLPTTLRSMGLNEAQGDALHERRIRLYPNTWVAASGRPIAAFDMNPGVTISWPSVGATGLPDEFFRTRPAPTTFRSRKRESYQERPLRL